MTFFTNSSIRRFYLKKLSCAALLAVLPSCSIILGTDSTVDTKSHHYNVVRLDRQEPQQWVRLQTEDPERPQTEEGDLAFEHRKSGAIISINSVCGQTRETSLEDLSKYLLLGINTRGPVTTRELELDHAPALESTVNATMVSRRPGSQAREQPVRLSAVVTRKGTCTYDLMYIARPDEFDRQMPAFEAFLKGFHAK